MNRRALEGANGNPTHPGGTLGKTDSSVVVQTTGGCVRGQRRGDVVRFLGVPYAAAPVGANRLRPPQDVRPWTGVRDALLPGPWPPQNGDKSHTLMPGEATRQSEDCLTVNVWTSHVGDGSRPVVVWLHGGGFIEGSGAAQLYDGHELAAHGDVVVVTGNYRVGLLGFAAHESLRDEQTGARGNWGLLDQMLLLRWVRSNAGVFGGDGARVTVIGHSAGAMSICDLMTSRHADGLFDRAIAQSGGPSAVTMDEATRTVEWVLSRLGVDDPRMLRTIPVGDLLRVQSELAMAGRAFATRPVIDGAVLEEHPLEAAAHGRTNPVPLVIGTTRDEVRLFYAGTPVLEALTDRGLRGRMSHVLGARRGDEIIETYRRARAARGADTSPGKLFVAIESDRTLRVPATRFAEGHALMQPSTYMYRFDVEANDGRGAAHGVDVPFVFGRRDISWIDWGPNEVALSKDLQRIWSRWAHGRSPAAPEAIRWPPYDSTRRMTQIFAMEGNMVDAPDETERSAWCDQEIHI